MLPHEREISIVYVGGKWSMTVLPLMRSWGKTDLPGIIDDRYIRSRTIELSHPDRMVAIYAYADPCRAIRQTTFQVAVRLGHYLEETGDVAVAMENLKQHDESERFIMETCGGNLLFETVERIAGDSKLRQRMLAKLKQTFGKTAADY